jgi:hypothetical protein
LVVLEQRGVLGLGHCGELALDLAVHCALKADEQLLVQHRSDALSSMNA